MVTWQYRFWLISLVALLPKPLHDPHHVEGNKQSSIVILGGEQPVEGSVEGSVEGAGSSSLREEVVWRGVGWMVNGCLMMGSL